MVSETKLHESFPQRQFKISVIFQSYIKSVYISAKLIFTEISPSEGFYVEILLIRQKWLICCFYNPNKHNISNHIEALSNSFDLLFSNYENILLMGDFDAGLANTVLIDFRNLYNLTSLINKATCSKNSNNPSCIDLLLTNFPKNFQNSNVIETGLSDFHKMVVTVTKTNFRKLKPKIINYRNYGYFSNDRELSKVVVENSDNGFNKFLGVCKEALDMYAPLKKKYYKRK